MPGATRRRLAQAALVWPLSALLSRPARAQAGGFTRAEVRGMQAVVQAQLKALAAGDAAGAYAHASPAIQQQFGNAERFMAMVREAYPMIIGPRSLAFRVPEREAAGAVMPVQLRDRAGRAWLATYRLEPQAGGGWRIGGCVVTADDSRLSA